MWQPSGEQAGDVRQGDLLIGVVLPRLEFPLPTARAPDAPPREGDSAVVRTTIKPCIVVSQCCEIENGRTIAVAPVKSTPPLGHDETSVYEAIEPTAEVGGYAYDGFRLESIPGVLDPLDRNRLHVASLSEIVSIRCSPTALMELRAAEMDVEARRALRIKLGFFFGRAEREDAMALAEMGISPGASA